MVVTEVHAQIACSVLLYVLCECHQHAVHTGFSSPLLAGLPLPGSQAHHPMFRLRDFDKSLCMQAESLTYFLTSEQSKHVQ